jgi:hypothetical protein
MSDERLPGGPRLPSIPKLQNRGRELADTVPPPENEPDRLMRLLEEVKAASANLGDLVSQLHTAIAVTQLAMLTYEHQVHNAHDRIDLLTDRVLDLESAAE